MVLLQKIAFFLSVEKIILLLVLAIKSGLIRVYLYTNKVHCYRNIQFSHDVLKSEIGLVGVAE